MKRYNIHMKQVKAIIIIQKRQVSREREGRQRKEKRVNERQ